eukprot:TRINITY_DN5416_c0_g1_i1.p1 TRINITY_DN5416_c0_g1~~TRINITY_DN5416_c0_g1_i1.p1  ORF type:complete len:404 (+),score=105.32 TRINITY_DN5416_c0_g1_i1:39-1214(+)
MAKQASTDPAAQVELKPNPQVAFDTPIVWGNVSLQHRVVMASLTRNRCMDTYPNELNQLYYEQRATPGGLIFSEHLVIEAQGSEWINAPGIYDDKAVECWSKIVSAVHAQKAFIYAQLWHGGRCCHPLHQSGRLPRGPSAIKAKGGRFRLLSGDSAHYVTPVEIENPLDYVEQFKKAAINAKRAGFDGVEVHSAGGFLPNQFLDTSSNQRTDQWGGSAANRCRFLLAVVDALIDVYGDSKAVGIKVAPVKGYNDVGMPLNDTLETYCHLFQELSKREIGHIQIERGSGPREDPLDVDIRCFRKHFNGTLIMNGGFDGPTGLQALKEGSADLISFGSFFISNPDLPKRILKGCPLRPVDYSLNYGVWNTPENWHVVSLIILSMRKSKNNGFG